MLEPSPRRKVLWALYCAMFFFSFHSYFLLYIQSTFISAFIPEQYLLYIYIIGALISILVFLNVTKILSVISNKRLMLWLIVLEALTCSIMAASTTPFIIIAAFILQLALLPILSFTIDILLEDYSQNRDTGLIRSFAFTAANIALIISPFIAGLIGNRYGFNLVFYLSILFLIPFFIIIIIFKKSIEEPVYDHPKVLTTLKHFLFNNQSRDKNIRRVFMANFLLQTFYSWMVIYSPLYLLHLGFSWDKIGIIFSIMLLPFLFFELPLGPIADKYTGEKEIMGLGFIILAGSTIALSFIHSEAVFIWAIALFITRTGASFIEIMSETYFFKQITGTRAYDIGLFRLTRPLSAIVAPIIASASILFVGEKYSFIILGIGMLYGLRFVLPMIDTK